MPAQLRTTGGDAELAILVHGTFAGHPSDSGDKWWQDGSEVSQKLQEKLPGNLRIAKGEQVFHWSGENGERARSKAAQQLLEHLRPLEEAGQSYHLVGHSHGGSVIWNALRIATLTKKPLRGLKSWTTVGTPFLHHASRHPLHPVNLLGVMIGVAFIYPVCRTVWGLSKLIGKAINGEPVEIIAVSDAEAGYMAVLRAPFLALAEFLGVSVDRTAPEGIRLGSYDPESNTSLVEYLFATPEGLVLLCVIMLTIYVLLHLGVMALRPVIESRRIHSESQLQMRAYERYGKSWLGIWTPHDEAINGLRATLKLSMSFVKKITPTERVFITDTLSLLSRPYYWVLAPIYNRLLRPLADSMVQGLLIRSAQGNDRPSSLVVDVLPAPYPESGEAPPLPQSTQDRLLSSADRHASDLAPKLRQLLGSPCFTSGLEAFHEELSGKEMVHTSYFEDPDVLALIVCNIVANAQACDRSMTLPGRREVVEWYCDFHTMHQRINDEAAEQPIHEELQPHRRAG